MKVVNGRHIGVYGVIIKDEKIALVKKARGGYIGKLDLPGGGMEYGEGAVETLKRELMEEAGVEVNEFKLDNVYTNTIKWQMTKNTIEDLYHIGIIYLITNFQNDLKRDGDGIDSDGADWYEIKKLNLENLTPFARIVVENYYK